MFRQQLQSANARVTELEETNAALTAQGTIRHLNSFHFVSFRFVLCPKFSGLPFVTLTSFFFGGSFSATTMEQWYRGSRRRSLSVVTTTTTPTRSV